MSNENMIEKIHFIEWQNVMQCLLPKKENEYVSSVIQKVNWNITDFNLLLNSIASKRDIVYFIVLCDWISEGCSCIYKSYGKYTKDFTYANESMVEDYNNKFKAIRSFIVAHPLTTDRHAEQGYDGTKKCIDIEIGLSEFDKTFQNYDKEESDFYLSVYEDGMTYKNEGHDYSEIYFCVYYNIEKMNMFIKYLSKIRKKDLCKYQLRD